MVYIPSAGLAKVQRLPHAYWQELRGAGNKAELLAFVRKHPEIEGIIRRELGPGVANRIVRSGKFRGDSDLTYIADLLKSAILRGAGSEKSLWAPWVAGRQELSCTPFGSSGIVSFSEGGEQFSFKTPGLITISDSSFSNLQKAAELLFAALDPSGSKFLIRADFVLESTDEGMRWWLVDVGESNLALVLASRLHQAAHTGHEFAAHYVRMVKSILPSDRKVLAAYQDDRLRECMPYEFFGLASIMIETGLRAEFLSKSQLLSQLSQSDPSSFASQYSVLRLFRHLEEGDMPILSAACSAGTIMLDSPHFAHLMRKSAVERAVWDVRAELSRYVGVPRGMLMQLSDKPWEVSEAIVSRMFNAGISEIVIKPGSPGKQYLPTAYFYNLYNPRHLSELTHTLKKLYASGVSTVIAEEMVGNGSINGRKLEVRLWCFREDLIIDSQHQPPQLS